MVARLLTEHRATIAVAESCTGGLLAGRLTNVPGSSNYFLGGVVCYSNELKTAMVDVPAELIEAKGAVSTEVALALADGIRKSTGATLGVGVTGIAGPGAARRKSRWAWCTSASRMRAGRRNGRSAFPATASASARKRACGAGYRAALFSVRVAGKV